MHLTKTAIDGVYVVEPDVLRDSRGFFLRAYDEAEWTKQGLTPLGTQHNISRTVKKGTIRGFHYQVAPHEQAKAIRCTKGAVFDVAIDLRPTSPTFGKYAGVELTADNHLTLYIPEGCAHGFQTLTDDAEVFYPLSYPYMKEAERGIRYDDPTFAVPWPLPLTELSEKDAALPFLSPA